MPTDQLAAVADLTTLIAPAKGGDQAARNELFRRAYERLERLTRRMVRGYPVVCRWTEPGDVCHTAAMRLLRALEGTPIVDTHGFFNLAAAVIRRELIDLARKFQGPLGVGANHASHAPGLTPDPAAGDPDPADLERWAALHEAVDRLPADEREVFGLIFYHGWKQGQIAALFGVEERTVRRRFRRAVETLHRLLGGDFPGGERGAA